MVKTQKGKIPPPYLVSILPFVVAVQDYKSYHPDTLLKMISKASRTAIQENKSMLREINKYLTYYGYQPIGATYDSTRHKNTSNQTRKQEDSGV